MTRSLLVSALLTVALAGEASARPGDGRVEVGRVAPELERAVSLGAANPDVPLERAILVLRPRDPAGLARFLAAAHDPASPEYRRWLTPEEFGRRFGAAQAEIEAIAGWLARHGLSVESVGAGRGALLVSGRVGDFARAFEAPIEELVVDGRPVFASRVPPTMPAEIARPVAGLLALQGTRPRQPLVRAAPEAGGAASPGPLYNSGSQRRFGPADFARVYGLEPLYAAGVDGRGASVAIVARTTVDFADTSFFREYFGLPVKDPELVLNGPDPGELQYIEVLEANLDLQWAGGVAPAANVKFVVSKSTAAADGIDLSSLYAVDQNVADIVSVSFGQCEKEFLAADLVFYDNIWAQAAAQGISIFVASGDSGASGCESGGASTGLGLGVNGLSTPPYATCVGGSQLDEGGDIVRYWEETNDPVTKRSAKSYVPETTWNESGVVPGGSRLYGTGGGLSEAFARPAWQAVPGLEAGPMRAVPDVSVNAANHTAYLLVQGHTSSFLGLLSVFGTSASAPAFAGYAALAVQRAGGRLGSLNPRLYALGNAQYGSGGASVFHDVTTGHNSVPGVTGFGAGTGFDLVTGLGTPDGAALVEALASPPQASGGFAIGAHPADPKLAAPGKETVTISLDGPAQLVATVTLVGLPTGLTAEFVPAQHGTPAVGYVSSGRPAKLTLTAAEGLASDVYLMDVLASAGGVTRVLRLAVTVGSPAAIPPQGVRLQVPVVLDLFGIAPSHYTSDLVAVNRSGENATLQLRYLAQPGTSGTEAITVARSLPAGQDLHIPDVIAFLARNGYSFSSDSSAKLGTLFATFAGVNDPGRVFVGSRTTTPNVNKDVGGAFGTFSAATRTGTASAEEAWVYGLRQSSAFRSNLGLVHSPASVASGSMGPVMLEVQLFDGDTGQPAGAPVIRTLQPGEFHQLNASDAPLAGVANAYVRIRRTSGADRFIAYGVVNDGAVTGGGTSDGSIVESGGGGGLVPIVLDAPGSPHFQTELVLVNTTTAAATVSLMYTPSHAFPDAKGGGKIEISLGSGRQLLIANVIAYLRAAGLAIPGNGTQGGTLLVAGAVALARTFNPNPDTTVGGTYGLAYPAVPGGARAKTRAIVSGLRQDADVRSNLAIADARVGEPSAVTYVVELFDAVTGGASPVRTHRVTLAGGQWAQLNTPLAEAGLTRSYAVIRPESGSSDFVAYGVVNDGPTAGSRTSDGSYLPMTASQN